MRSLNATELKRLHRSWRRRSDARLAILLDGVQGPFNVGSILRTAAAMGVDALYATGLDVSWTDVKVQKTAMGTHRFIELENFDTCEQAVAAITDNGYCLVGIELADAAAPIWDLDISGDICFAVGHEDRGLSAKTLHACSHVGYIPQFGKVGSMNVATAAAIACYEARRQETSATGDAPETTSTRKPPFDKIRSTSKP